MGAVQAQRTHPQAPFGDLGREIFLTAGERCLNFLQGEQMIAHVGQGVIAKRIGKSNELALIGAKINCTMPST